MSELSKTQERVLRYLYEYKDEAPLTERISKALGLTTAVVTRALNDLTELGLVSGPPSLADIVGKTLKEMDAELTPLSPHYAEHVILLASFLAPAANLTGRAWIRRGVR